MKTPTVERKTIRGLGTLILRGDTWHCHYYLNAVRYRESTHATTYNDAVKFLKRRITEVQTGRFAGTDVERVTMATLLEDVLDDYRMHHPDSVNSFAQPILNRLTEWFGAKRAATVTTESIRAFIKARMKEGAAPATINRDLGMLRRAFNLGRQQSPPKVGVVPNFKGLMFKENNARQGFFEHADYIRMRDALSPDERAVFVAGYYTLMRYAALLTMRWDWVDLNAQAIRVPPGVIKNDDPLTIATGGPGAELHELLAQRFALRNELCPECPWVFFRSMNYSRGKAAHQIGKPVLSIRAVMDNVKEQLGLQGKLFHDLRRTGARNLRRAGVSEGVIMRAGGWRTRSIFERYNIKDTADLHDAAAKLNAYLEAGQHA